MKNQKINKVSRNNEDDGFSVNSDEYLPFFERNLTLSCIEFSLDEQIKDASYYRKVIRRINDLGQHDSVKIRINSYGGLLDSTIALLHALYETEAHITTILEGTAASAASLILLAGDEIVIGKYGHMMIHSASFGAGGIARNVLENASFTEKHARELMTDVYEGFLTEEELAEVFKGMEIRLDSKQISERLEARFEYFQKLEEDQAKEVTKPKKSKKGNGNGETTT